MLYGLVVLLHVLVSLVLILVVLLQTGKRADLAGAFGGGGSQTAFGVRGASTFFSKMTTTCAVIFMLTSLILAVLSTQAASRSRSVLDEAQLPTSAPAPIQSPVPGSPNPATDDPLPANPDTPAGGQDPS
jgi:preprotein translocase subunit SecG